MPNNIKKGGKPANKSKNRGWNLKRKSTGKPRNANPAGKNKDQQGKSDDNTSSSGQRENSAHPAMSSRPSRLLWTYDETVALISIFEDKCIQDALKNTIRNHHIYDIVSSKMTEMGYFRTPIQCRIKVRNLKAEYKSAKCGDPRESRKIPIYLPLLEGLFGPKSEAGDSPPSTPLDATKKRDSGNRFSSSQSDLKLVNVFHLDNMNNYFNESVQWKQSSSHAVMPDHPDLDIDGSSEKSPSHDDLDTKKDDDDDDVKSMDWCTFEKKQKPLSSKAQKKIHALKMVMETITNQFMQHQEASEQRFYEFERERMQHEAEMEDKRMMFMREEIERQNQDEERREMMMMQVLERMLRFFENTSQGSVPRTSQKT